MLKKSAVKRPYRWLLILLFLSACYLPPALETAHAKLGLFKKKPSTVTDTATPLVDPIAEAEKKATEITPVIALPEKPSIAPPATTPVTDLCFKLPEVMLSTLLQLDKNLKLRSDCYVLLSNGQSYLPVLPQKLTVLPPTTVVRQWGDKLSKTNPPDLIQFDNDWYLIKLTPTDTGKITFARLATYPTSLKEGVIPQNWFVPAGLSIPAELRVLLGNLDYTTPAPSTPETKNTANTPQKNAPEAVAVNAPRLQLQPTFFYTDFLSATLQGLDTRTGEARLAMKIDTLAASVLAVPAGDGVWVASVNQPEILVVNPVARLISTRLETVAPTTKLLYAPWNDTVVATHKSKPQLTLFDGKNRLFLGTIALPKPVGTAVMRKRFPIGYFAATQDNTIYEVDVATKKVIRVVKPAEKATETYLTKIDALWLNEPAKGLGQLWLLDKQAQKLQVIQVFTGAVLKTISLPVKPLELVGLGNSQLAVLTEDKTALTVVDTATFETLAPLALAPTTQLPFTFATNAEKTQLVVFDGLASQLQVINLKTPSTPIQLLKVVGRSKQGAFYEPSTVTETETSATAETLSDEVKAELAALQGLNTQPQRLKRLERLWAKWQSGSRGLH